MTRNACGFGRIIWLSALIVLCALSTSVAELRGHGGPVQTLAIADDGIHGLSGGFDYAVVYWDFQNSRALTRLLGHDGGVNAVAFIPNALSSPNQAVSGGDDGHIILWDLPRQSITLRFKGHEKRVVAVSASPDGEIIASAAWDRSVRLWDIQNGQLLHSFAAGGNRPSAVVFTKNGRRVAASNDLGEIREWDVITGERTRLLRAHAFPINALALSGDGRILASASVDMTIRLWQWPSAVEIALIELHDTAVLGLAMSQEGKLLASAGADGIIQLWSIPDGKPLGSLKGHIGAVWSVRFSPDGTKLYSAGRDEQIRIWDMASLSEINPGGVHNIPQPERVANMTEAEKRGQWQFRKCRICHSVAKDSENRAGPSLYKVIGRPVGQLASYTYSPALRHADFIWTEQKIMELFLLGPQTITPGSKMPLQRLRNRGDVEDLMSYIRRVTGGRFE